MNKIIFRSILAASMACAVIYGAKADEVTAIINNATKHKIEGRVIDAQSKEPLPFCTVVVLGTSLGGVTDVNGHFTIQDVPTSTPTVRVSFVGYATQEVVLSNSGDHVIALTPTSINMQEVVVSANRAETRRNVAPVLVNVTGQKLFNVTNSVTVDQALKFNPGIRVEDNCQNCGFNQVRINGLDGSYSQIVINSRSIFSALAGVYALEMFPTSMIDRVEVVRGGSSALYGSSAIGGTVNIITKAPARNMAEASYTITSMKDNWGKPSHDVGLFASVIDDSQRAGVSVFGKMKSQKGMDFVRPGSKLPGGKDGFTDLPQLYSTTVGTSAFYAATPTTRLTLDYFYTQEERRGGDRLELPEHEAQIAESLRHRIHTGIFQLNQNLFEGEGLLTAFLAGSRTHRNSYYGGGDLVFTKFNEKSLKDIERALGAYGVTKDLTLQSGVQYVHRFDRLLFMPSELSGGFEHQYNKLNDNSGYRPEKINQVVNTSSLFLQNEWRNNRFGLLLGGRFDYVQLNPGKSDRPLKKLPIFTPRVTVRYNPTDQLHIRGGYGEGFRAPQFFDEELHVAFAGGEGKPRVLSPNLREERSRSVTLSADYYFTVDKDYHFNIMGEGFYTHLRDKFNAEDRGKTLEVVNASSVRVYGINMEMRSSYRNLLSLDLGLTVQRSLFDKPENVGIEGIESREVMRTPNTYGYFVFNWTPDHHFSLTLSGDYTGKMYVPHEAGEVLKDYITISEGRLERSKSFFTLGTKVNYAIHVENSMLEFSIGANNIFNSYQKDFDEGPNRASSYIYGPKQPRSIFAGIKLTL